MKRINIIGIMLVLLPISLAFSMEDSAKTKKGTKRKIEQMNAVADKNTYCWKKTKEEEIEAPWDNLPDEMKVMILDFVVTKDSVVKSLNSNSHDAVRGLMGLAFLSRVTRSASVPKLKEICSSLIKDKPLIGKIFLKAAETGNIYALKLLLDNNFALNLKFDEDRPNANDEKLLIRAIGYGHVQFCKYLIKQDMFANVKNASLIHAIILQDEDTVKALIEKGENEGMLFGKYTETMIAAAVGNLTIFKLFYPGKDENLFYQPKKDMFCLTSLQCAALNGHINIVQLLLNVENNYNMRISGYDHYWDQVSAFVQAARNNHLGIVALILLEGKVDIDEAGFYEHMSALMEACINGHAEMVELLIKRGANCNPDNVNNDDIPIIEYACAAGSLAIVKLLLRNGSHFKGNENWNALMEAVTSGSLEIAKLLVSYGADVHFKISNGRTCLIQAALYGHLDIVSWLLSLKVDIHALNNEGLNATDLAKSEGYDNIVALLLAHGGNLSTST